MLARFTKYLDVFTEKTTIIILENCQSYLFNSCLLKRRKLFQVTLIRQNLTG